MFLVILSTQFSFSSLTRIFNRSEIPLHFQVGESLSACISITPASTLSKDFVVVPVRRDTDERAARTIIYILNPTCKCIFSAIFDPRLVDGNESGSMTFDVPIKNMHNDFDSLHLTLQVTLSRFDLLFQNLRANGCLSLPTIEYPSASKPIEEMLTIRRQAGLEADKSTRFALSLEIFKPYSVSLV